MRLLDDPESFWSGFDSSLWATPFSGFRWAIPARCEFAGRAIYMDSDVIVQADIAQLWRHPMGAGKVAIARGDKAAWRFCVSLWDCDAAAAFVLPLHELKRADGHQRMTAMVRQHREMIEPFKNGQWNYCDSEDRTPIEKARIVHYTDMSCQPHLKHAIPRLMSKGQRHWYDGQFRPHPRPEVEALFDREYEAAIKAGFTPGNYVPNHEPINFRKRSLVNYRGHATA